MPALLSLVQFAQSSKKRYIYDCPCVGVWCLCHEPNSPIKHIGAGYGDNMICYLDMVATGHMQIFKYVPTVLNNVALRR